MAVSPLGGELEDAKDERLPGSGKGGMVAEQVASAENISILVSAPFPPLTMIPGKGKLNEIQTRTRPQLNVQILR